MDFTRVVQLNPPISFSGRFEWMLHVRNMPLARRMETNGQAHGNKCVFIYIQLPPSFIF